MTTPTTDSAKPQTSARLPLLVMGVAALLSLGVLVYTVLQAAPWRGRRGHDATDRVRVLAVHLLERSITRGWPKLGGKRLVLHPLAVGQVDRTSTDACGVFFSPLDDTRSLEDVAPERWRGVTLMALESGLEVRDLTSYAGRRADEPGFEIPEDPYQVVPLLADLHPPGGAIVGFSDGSVRYLNRSELGLGPEDPLVAGEASASPILRQLSDR